MKYVALLMFLCVVGCQDVDPVRVAGGDIVGGGGAGGACWEEVPPSDWPSPNGGVRRIDCSTGGDFWPDGEVSDGGAPGSDSGPLVLDTGREDRLVLGDSSPDIADSSPPDSYLGDDALVDASTSIGWCDLFARRTREIGCAPDLTCPSWACELEIDGAVNRCVEQAASEACLGREGEFIFEVPHCRPVRERCEGEVKVSTGS